MVLTLNCFPDNCQDVFLALEAYAAVFHLLEDMETQLHSLHPSQWFQV